MERLNAMSMFVRVVESGNFSTAAKDLKTTQPTVSKNISELENWLGAKLLNRSTRSLRLTETGAAYYERCIAILQDIEEAEQAIGMLQTQPKGLVRISAGIAFGQLHIMPRLEGFFERYPDIQVDLILNDLDGDLTVSGIDIAFRMGDLRDSNQIAVKLCASPTMTVASPAYLKKHGTPNHPRDLKEYNYLISTDINHGDYFTFEESSKPFQINVGGNLRTNNSNVLRNALIDGMGIAQVPKWLVADQVASANLIEVLPQFQKGPTNIHIVYCAGRHVPLKLRCFIDYFSNELRQCSAICR